MVSKTSKPLDNSGSQEQVNSDIAALSYEQARDQLVAIVSSLESGTSTLEESLTLWERGEALASHCQKWLDEARVRLDAARGRSESESITQVTASEY